GRSGGRWWTARPPLCVRGTDEGRTRVGRDGIGAGQEAGRAVRPVGGRRVRGGRSDPVDGDAGAGVVDLLDGSPRVADLDAARPDVARLVVSLEGRDDPDEGHAEVAVDHQLVADLDGRAVAHTGHLDAGAGHRWGSSLGVRGAAAPGAPPPVGVGQGTRSTTRAVALSTLWGRRTMRDWATAVAASSAAASAGTPVRQPATVPPKSSTGSYAPSVARTRRSSSGATVAVSIAS